MANSGRIHERLEQNSHEMTEKATLTIKGKFLPKMVNLTKAKQMFSKTHKCVDKKKACENLGTS